MSIQSYSFDRTSIATYGSFSAWVTAMGSDSVGVRIMEEVAITADLTIPATITVGFGLASGSFTVASGKTLTISRMDPGAPLRQLFAGAGTVALYTGLFADNSVRSAIDHVYAEWFGAVPDGSTNSAAYIQSALDCARWAGVPLLLNSGYYYVTSPIVCFRTTDDSNMRAARIYGASNRSSILYTGLASMHSVLKFETDSGHNASYAHFRGFNINIQGAVQYGIAGRDSADSDGGWVSNSLFEELEIRGATQRGINLSNCWLNRIQNCLVASCGTSGTHSSGGIGLEGQPNSVVVVNNTIASNKGLGIIVGNGGSVVIKNNDFESNYGCGVFAYGIRGLVVDDNYFEYNGITTPTVLTNNGAKNRAAIILNGGNIAGVTNTSPCRGVSIRGNFVSQSTGGLNEAFIKLVAGEEVAVENNSQGLGDSMPCVSLLNRYKTISDTCTATSGSPVISGWDSSAFIRYGDYIRVSARFASSLVKVVDYSSAAGTVTVNENATSSGAVTVTQDWYTGIKDITVRNNALFSKPLELLPNESIICSGQPFSTISDEVDFSNVKRCVDKVNYWPDDFNDLTMPTTGGEMAKGGETFKGFDTTKITLGNIESISSGFAKTLSFGTDYAWGGTFTSGAYAITGLSGYGAADIDDIFAVGDMVTISLGWSHGIHEVTAVDATSVTVGDQALISLPTESGTATSGSPIITGMSDTSDFEPSDKVYISAGFSPNVVTIKAVTASTITVDADSSATGAVTVRKNIVVRKSDYPELHYPAAAYLGFYAKTGASSTCSAQIVTPIGTVTVPVKEDWQWTEFAYNIPWDASGVSFAISATHTATTADYLDIACPVLARVGVNRDNFYTKPFKPTYKVDEFPTVGTWNVGDKLIVKTPANSTQDPILNDNTYTHIEVVTSGTFGSSDPVFAKVGRIGFPYSRLSYSDSVPAAGCYKEGDLVFNSGTTDGIVGWKCITTGSFQNLAATGRCTSGSPIVSEMSTMTGIADCKYVVPSANFTSPSEVIDYTTSSGTVTSIEAEAGTADGSTTISAMADTSFFSAGMYCHVTGETHDYYVVSKTAATLTLDATVPAGAVTVYAGGYVANGSPRIKGITDTSTFSVGEYVKVSKGFASSTAPYKILAKDGTSLTIDSISTAAVLAETQIVVTGVATITLDNNASGSSASINVTTSDPTFEQFGRIIDNTTDATAADTGSVQTKGGLYVAKAILLGTVPPEYADDAAAATGGLAVGGIYRTGSALKVRVA